MDELLGSNTNYTCLPYTRLEAKGMRNNVRMIYFDQKNQKQTNKQKQKNKISTYLNTSEKNNNT